MAKELLYNTSYYLNQEELFTGFDIKSLDVKRSTLRRAYKNSTTLDMCGRVFTYFLYLVLLDIIENNITFVFPTKYRMELSIDILEGERLLRLLRRNHFSNYDPFAFGFKLPLIGLLVENSTVESFIKPVCFSGFLLDKYYKYLLEGKRYG